MRFLGMRSLNRLAITAICFLIPANLVQAGDKDAAFRLNGKTITLEDIHSEDQSAFYDIEKKKYELVEDVARNKYLQAYWEKMAKDKSSSVDKVRSEYLDKTAKVSGQELKETLEKFKDHPQLKKLSKEDREKQVRDYLKERGKQEVLDGIVDSAYQKGELVVLYPRPKEPVYTVSVNDNDVMRYGPKLSDTAPQGCEGAKCQVTIVEYSEFQCPFCERVLPTTAKILEEFKGKIRWTVRDFPLSFHDRAKPAAVAARCAAKQGKYWEMYDTLFKNQSNLGDKDLANYAGKIGVDAKKWQACVQKPDEVNTVIEANFQSGVKLGVTGTPAFFINGRRLSGALPYSEFKKVIDEELQKGRG